ncbi:chromosome segregation protein SMC [Modestobacter sp. VKM Ac-2979]|uniref:chromosome segregation protein SMC n=1 Tax=unclassified Modestobacter TaxID=2643866 RepID=UPI0022AB7C7A|nr:MULTISPECIES: chromosome segregation protein SMC [unclassified Modestobacter]MCZ2812632.1 chromosome segregation protein SMC [Modestobacter sp. VKM Ac-2979]MCZ2841522.1 chromosome segregation protein SMC [Modestobacter sp. VKM Ac-2980]
MHLSSLTLKGFKSFASPTTLRLERGITAVVGPNGSGKSNVVDAIAWVLGEQGAKSLRGGKMEDVIFAGTAGRPALGRAEVTLTIDNADGALPIDYTEVSITRRMYRSGESEYEINGDKVRLLDVQELLSDSGIGREMHVIVGQGQLDAVLSGRPEDRRAFVEEAAGVLKHRKRKEKALRKLDAMQANLDRLGDLTAELRRQLKPLGRQAEVARRAAGVQADLRDARLRLLADDLVDLRDALDADIADETAARARRATVETALGGAAGNESALERQLAADAPVLAAAQDSWFRLSTLAERFRSVAQLAAERHRHLAAVPAAAPGGRDPDQLDAEADRVDATERELAASLEAERARLDTAVAVRGEVETALAEAERALVAAARALADRREQLARLSGQVAAGRSRAAAGEAEIERLAAAATEAADRAEVASDRLTARREELSADAGGDEGLAAAHAAAGTAHTEAARAVTELAAAERAAERDRAGWQARRDALALGLAPADGAAAVLAAALPGVLGPVPDRLTVQPGAEVALAAALGGMADAVVVAGVEQAAAVLTHLARNDGGRAGLLVTGGLPAVSRDGWPELPAGARWALDLVEAPAELAPALARALERVAVVPDLSAAVSLVRTHPRVRAVTDTGDLLGADWSVGGQVNAPSGLEVRARVDEAAAELDRAVAHAVQLADELAWAREAATARSADVDAALTARQAGDRARSAAAAELAELGAAARSAVAEAERLDAARVRAEQAREQAVAGLVELEERLAAAEAAPMEEEPATDERDRLRAEATAARQAETEARLAVRTAEERARSLAGRAESLRRQARQERAARERAAAARVARERGARVAAEVRAGAEEALTHLATSLARAAAERDALAEARTGREAELLVVRARVREHTAELDRLTDEVHRDEVARAEQRLRIEALESRAAEEYGVDLPTLLAEYGPAAQVAPTQAQLAAAEAAGEPEPQPVPYDRSAQERRAARAERDLAALGKVNPLALEEFAALEERHTFLATQLEDLKATRRDLLTVVREVDARIHQVFAEAFADTQREFEQVFATLFPGGEGRIFLTDPENLLTTGVEVEARPPGKKVKRLSLLSGGERSLTAVALLVAIFRARPSPFYVLDEVEAALDDVNLGRLLTLIEQLRDTSQLIVITHQKRTMEIADALYGVSMRGDGITGVISQRLRELQAS